MFVPEVPIGYLGSGDGLAWNRQQAIAWNYMDKYPWHHNGVWSKVFDVQELLIFHP